MVMYKPARAVIDDPSSEIVSLSASHEALRKITHVLRDGPVCFRADSDYCQSARQLVRSSQLRWNVV